MDFSFKWRGRNTTLDVYKVPWWKEGVGLMFKRKKSAKILLFDLRKSSRMDIHSLFVFFPFIAIWLDEKKEVIEIKKIKPFRAWILPSREFRYLIEVPLTPKHDAAIKSLVGNKKI